MKTKPESVFIAFQKDLNSLILLDAQNQKHFSNVGSKDKLSKAQLNLLTESVFFAAFRSYEQFLRNIFLLYCCGIQSGGKRIIKSSLHPNSIDHAEALIKSNMPFLDWSSPDVVLDRAEIYLLDGYPFKQIIQSNIERLRDLKKLRNHIAHMSNESLDEYKKILKNHFAIIPLKIPNPGEFLLLPSRRAKKMYYLIEYIRIMEFVAQKIARQK